MKQCGKILYSRAGHMAVRRMRIARWIPTATNIHSEYVILLFYCKKWLNECANFISILPILLQSRRSGHCGVRIKSLHIIQFQSIAEGRVRYQVSLREICGKQSDTGISFSLFI
jgi:hypothetical protein